MLDNFSRAVFALLASTLGGVGADRWADSGEGGICNVPGVARAEGMRRSGVAVASSELRQNYPNIG